eukprot:PITA_32662
MRATSLDEVEEVVLSMKKGTAPGPDGFTVDFYQAGWHFMGKEIQELIEESRMNQKLYINPQFSILVNGTLSKTFKASRGIRQGDPISPFLFILAVEGLGSYLKQERIADNIKGLRLWGNELPITHQQFVDDIMLFGEPTVREVRNMKKALDLIAEASRMEINKDKSCTFIFNTVETIKRHLTRLLGFKQGDLPTKYLGNVLDYSSKRLKNWQGILEKLKNRVANWTFRTLNIAGRIALVKSVLQAIPIYPLSIMAVPQGVCTKIREILRKFIWGGSSNQKKWALVS